LSKLKLPIIGLSSAGVRIYPRAICPGRVKVRIKLDVELGIMLYNNNLYYADSPTYSITNYVIVIPTRTANEYNPKGFEVYSQAGELLHFCSTKLELRDLAVTANYIIVNRKQIENFEL